MTPRRFLLALAFIGSVVSLGACHREHLSSNYGLAYVSWFSAQHVKAKPANPEQMRKIIEELDATEATMVSKNYRRSTAGKSGEEAATGGRMLMIGPSRAGGGEAYIPPPSVPMGQ